MLYNFGSNQAGLKFTIRCLNRESTKIGDLKPTSSPQSISLKVDHGFWGAKKPTFNQLMLITDIFTRLWILWCIFLTSFGLMFSMRSFYNFKGNMFLYLARGSP
jgi:hypothetical protein